LTQHRVDTLSQLLAARAERTAGGELVGFIGDDQPVYHSAEELQKLAGQVHSSLQGLGCVEGDRVAIMCGNRVEFLASFFGAVHGGYVAVPVNVALRGEMLKHILNDSSPTVLICEQQFLDVIRAVMPASTVKHVVCIYDAVDDDSEPGTIPFWPMAASADTLSPVDRAASDLAAVLYTSGTTGLAKGVMLSQRMPLGFSATLDWAIDYRTDDVFFSPLPLFHANALLLTFVGSTLAGGRSVFAPSFSASRFWRQVRDSDATVLSLLGSIAEILVKRPSEEMERSHRVRVALIAPAPSDLKGFEERFRLELTEVYGSTDIGVPIAVPLGTERPAGSCGRCHPNWECRVVDDQDESVAPGESGELVVRPALPNLSQLGYFNRPDVTVKAWRNMWIHTGDVFRIDEEGWFYFLDRSSDVIRRGGENISSAEVEGALLSHPDILDATAYGVKSELAEDEVMAMIIVAPESALQPLDVVEYCRLRLPYYAVPRYVALVEELPRTETAKVMKAELRKRGVPDGAFDAGPTRRKTSLGGAAQADSVSPANS
jgi:crotonobetaine/carnitine-CoA ligase